ncbi:cyclase family protein [Tengunoibacter tsumagoiensis]|uniref:Cyclase n=1 Tax=Tengunoibacter tsumagoiensis TaxID=2014871 RepID=A0A402A8W6_9CHLR|nr:cyclase family protein [Tengunoibacter tsumagoiensis]GCE15624.1 cyclase [Tengunoibacter tsumagoiensis]
MQFIDITQGFYADMPSFQAKWYPKSAIYAVMTPETDPAHTGRTFTRLELFAHNATHVDVPQHFYAQKETLDQIPLDTFIGHTCIADLSHKAPREPITGDDLEQALNGIWTAGSRLIIRTDYHHHYWGHADFWDKPPYLVLSAADWIVEHGAVLVGLDCITDKPGDTTQPVHFRLLGAGVPILEYITNLHQIKQPTGYLIALPTKVDGVEAAPVRAIFVEDFQGRASL